MAAVTAHSDFGAQENFVTASTFSPSVCHKVMGPYSVILVFLMLSFKGKPLDVELYGLSPAWSFTTLNSIHILAAAAAAKSLQSCPTLCDPIDGSPPGSPVPGIL